MINAFLFLVLAGLTALNLTFYADTQNPVSLGAGVFSGLGAIAVAMRGGRDG